MKSSPVHKVATPEVGFAFHEYGSPAGTPLVLLHGFPDAPAAWLGVIEHLELKDLRVVVPYLRGYGETRVLQQDLVAGQEAALGLDLLAFADALGLKRFHVAGHDWGARSVYAASVLGGERIASAVTLATPYVMYGGRETPPAQVRAHWYQWYFQLEHGRTAMQENAVSFCHELWKSWSPEWKFAEREFAEAAKAWDNPQFAEIVLHYYRTRWGGALSERAYAEAQAKLNARPKTKIGVPTVYVQGGADACDLEACSEEQSEYFTGGYERVVLKSAGHFPHREDAKSVAKLVDKQVERYRAGKE